VPEARALTLDPQENPIAGLGQGDERQRQQQIRAAKDLVVGAGKACVR
jgi:hypothetical protein